MVGSFGTKNNTSAILRYDGATGAFIDSFLSIDSRGLRAPVLMAFTQTDPTTLAFTSPSKATSQAASLPSQPQEAIRSAVSAANLENSDYQQTNLTGFQPGLGRFTDPNLNGWGMDHTPNGPFTVANTSTGTITFYASRTD